MTSIFAKPKIILGIIVVPLALWWLSERLGIFQGDPTPIQENISKEKEGEEEA